MCDDDEGGNAAIAFKKHVSHHIVAIKCKSVDESWNLRKLYTIDHRNIVTLIEAFLWENNLYFVYESIGLSLADILQCPYGLLAEHEIAAICAGVRPFPKMHILH